MFQYNPDVARKNSAAVMHPAARSAGLITRAPRRPTRCAPAFSLIELLVVMFIIALLLGILLPVLPKARDAGKRVACSSNLRNVGQVIELYKNDFKEKFPLARYMPPPFLSREDQVKPPEKPAGVGTLPSVRVTLAPVQEPREPFPDLALPPLGEPPSGPTEGPKPEPLPPPRAAESSRGVPPITPAATEKVAPPPDNILLVQRAGPKPAQFLVTATVPIRPARATTGKRGRPWRRL